MISDPSRRNPDGPKHLGESVHSLRVLLMLGGPLFLFLCIAEFYWYGAGKYNALVLVLLLLPGNALIIYGMSRLIERAAGATAEAFGKTVLGAGNLPPDPGFSSEEALIIQGRLAEAEEALHDRWLRHPDLHEAGLRLAALLVQQDRPEEAEQVYLELRRRELPPKVANTVANRLIDLYQRLRRTDRLKVELARYSAEHKGTNAGEHAARRLREIKEQEAERKTDEGGD